MPERPSGFLEVSRRDRSRLDAIDRLRVSPAAAPVRGTPTFKVEAVHDPRSISIHAARWRQRDHLLPSPDYCTLPGRPRAARETRPGSIGRSAPGTRANDSKNRRIGVSSAANRPPLSLAREAPPSSSPSQHRDPERGFSAGPRTNSAAPLRSGLTLTST